MKKVKDFLKSSLNLAIMAGIFYLMFQHFLIFIGVLVLIIVLIVLAFFISAQQVLRYIEKQLLEKHIDVFKNISENNSELAKAAFKRNILARKIFEKILDAEYKKIKEKKQQTPTVSAAQVCMMVFNINKGELGNIQAIDIKRKWKNLAKVYHPDKFQGIELKNQMQDKFIKITKCKDNLLALIKARNENV